MEESCRYSFQDLHQAAFGRQMTEAERTYLYSLEQKIRNEIVARWAKKAKWLMEERIGTDGVTYIAFWR